ncbi:MAG: DUF87 domain-containing protein [Deltaproteobacteria bacterium]|nr:DUF87 domain-containing protein [Deltaproteobacteria bacterium]
MNQNSSPQQQISIGQALGIAGLAGTIFIATKAAERFHMGIQDAIIAITISVGVIGAASMGAMMIFKRKPKKAKSSGAEIVLAKAIHQEWWKADQALPIGMQDFRHILVTGTTGSGKSTFIRRFIEQILSKKKNFLYIDFKGERDDLDQIGKICKEQGGSDPLQVFDISNSEKCITFNPLTVFESVEETVGFISSVFFDENSNEYYQSEAERFLRHSINLLDAASETRTFESIQKIYYESTARSSLLKASKKSAGLIVADYETFFTKEFEALSPRDRSERYSGLMSILAAFNSNELKRIFSPEGESELKLANIFEAKRNLIIRVPGEVFGDLSARIVKAFIKIIPVLLVKRREERNRNEYCLLFDEGCSYMDETMIEILKKAGSANVKMLITRMCDADFQAKDPSFLGRMLSSFNLFVCFQTMDPDTRDTLARISMTIQDTKATSRWSQGADTGEASVRDVQRFRIHPSDFGTLKTGECFMIAPTLNLYQKVRVLPPESTRVTA